MVIRRGASWRAASSRARLKEPRRRLPANATTPSTSFNPCSATPASSTQEREGLGTFHARLEVFAYGKHLPMRQRLHHIALETHNRHLTGPARRVFHLGPPANITAGVYAGPGRLASNTQRLEIGLELGTPALTFIERPRFSRIQQRPADSLAFR